MNHAAKLRAIAEFHPTISDHYLKQLRDAADHIDQLTHADLVVAEIRRMLGTLGYKADDQPFLPDYIAAIINDLKAKARKEDDE